MKVRHIDWYADEWLAGTESLSLEERGVYVTICNLIYSHGGPIPDDETELAHRCNCHWRTLRAIMKSLQDKLKIVSESGHVDVRRCSRELQKAFKRHSEARQNGAKGGRPIKEINDIDKPDGFRGEKLTRAKPTNLPTTNHEEESPGGDSIHTSASSVVKKGSGSGRRKPRQGFPPDWLPSERGVEFAHSHGRDDAWIGREGPHCREHHIGKGTLFADLDAAWRTWVLNAERFEPAGGTGSPRSGGGGSGTSRIAAALNKVHLASPVSGFH